jgi:hypothetical protein
MSSVATIIFAVPMAIGIGIFVWYVWDSNRKLDSRIAAGDLDLLTSPNYKISEVIRAPQGSRVEKVAIQQVPIDSSQYIRQVLPDGRVALIPITHNNQQITTDYSTMHNNQQPPGQ